MSLANANYLVNKQDLYKTGSAEHQIRIEGNYDLWV